MLNIEIDGKATQVAPGTTVIEAAHALGIYVPHFCYHKKLSIAANCRMCLVQVEKAPKPLPACATPVTEGMKVYTASEQAVTAQKGVMEFLLINHPLDCPICDQGGECQLQDLAVGYGGSSSRYQEAEARRLPQGPGAAHLGRGDDPLHPVHALHPLRAGDRRHHGARHDRPRRARGDRLVRRQDRRLGALGQLDRRVPGRRADVQAVPLRGADVGALAPQVGVAARLARQQPHRAGEGRARDARAAARERGDQRVLDLGQGPLLVRGPQLAKIACARRWSSRAASGRRSTGRPRSTSSRRD